MTTNQRATINALYAAGAILLVLGIVILVVAANSVEETCYPGGFAADYCVSEPVSMLGVWVAIPGAILLVAAFVAKRTLYRAVDW
ncbi:hypothetical protein [Rhodococcus sp. AQ5-07]|uniref:hypothetical protein n=1 Tax=Rhodococcus sp. AQ5-07 TaxID=2054902 RepID=UPI000DC04732|nr:hypothetical protein [Rhodococcus sp. AQ5-07]RAL31135.1 hypothetical protein CVN56_29645 [Rhodococcus sp. AQ5-07]